MKQVLLDARFEKNATRRKSMLTLRRFAEGKQQPFVRAIGHVTLDLKKYQDL